MSKKNKKRLALNNEKAYFLGVCRGVADYLDIDPFLIRFIFAIMAIYFGFGLSLYIILYICMPNPHEVERDN